MKVKNVDLDPPRDGTFVFITVSSIIRLERPGQNTPISGRCAVDSFQSKRIMSHNLCNLLKSSERNSIPGVPRVHPTIGSH